MPGIAGIVGSTAPGEGERIVSLMLSAMMHEPSCHTGLHVEPTVGVHVGWVAHPGSYAARWSGRDRDGIVAVVAGECVADQSEVDICRRFHDSGERALLDLNGLFSALLVDRQARRAVLFNDRYGMERLYVHRTKARVYFASEAGALVRTIPETRGFDDEGVARFLAFGCIQPGRTPFRNVELLEGGTFWQLAGPEVSPKRYFNVGSWESQTGLDPEQFNVALGDTLEAVLPRYVGSGSAIGVSLTGGLDTRMIMACLPALQDAPVCYTFAGEGPRTLDEGIAAEVAAICGLEHRVIRVGKAFLSEFGRYVDQTVLASDGNAGATAAHEVYLNAQAGQLAPIRLTGNFGSEVLRGMSTFKPLGLSAALLAPDVGARAAEHARTTLDYRHHPVTSAVFRDVPAGLFGTVAAARSHVTFKTPYLDNQIVALAYRAPRHSLETPDAALHVVRTRRPQLALTPTDRGLRASDGRVMRLARRLGSAAAFKLDYLHTEGLPGRLAPLDAVLGALARTQWLGAHKYLQYRRWFQGELAAHVTDVLTDSRTTQMPFWRGRAAIEAILRDHLSGRCNHVREINTLLSFEALSRLLLAAPIGSDVRGPATSP